MTKLISQIEGENWEKTIKKKQPVKPISKFTLFFMDKKRYTFGTLLIVFTLLCTLFPLSMIGPETQEYLGIVRSGPVLNTDKFGVSGEYVKINDDYSIIIRTDYGENLKIYFANINIIDKSVKNFIDILLKDKIILLDLCDACITNKLYAVVYIKQDGYAINVNYLLVQSEFATIDDNIEEFNTTEWVISEAI
jgi:hypothetical protein